MQKRIGSAILVGILVGIVAKISGISGIVVLLFAGILGPAIFAKIWGRDALTAGLILNAMAVIVIILTSFHEFVDSDPATVLFLMLLAVVLALVGWLAGSYRRPKRNDMK